MKRDSIAIPVAIVIAAGLIAGAIYLNGAKAPPSAPIDFGTGGAAEQAANAKPVIKPVEDTDHIRGNPNAPIMIVEYSDYDCPFCDIFHETLNRLMSEYEAGGKVAWVFRHFPIQQLHPTAPKIAEASECVAELGGNAAFWQFTDSVFESKIVDQEKKIVEFTDMTKLPAFAAQAGVDAAAFQTCLDSGKYKEKVDASIREAAAAGAKGTPFPIVIVGNQNATLEGAVPYASLKGMIDNLIKQIAGE